MSTCHVCGKPADIVSASSMKALSPFGVVFMGLDEYKYDAYLCVPCIQRHGGPFLEEMKRAKEANDAKKRGQA